MHLLQFAHLVPGAQREGSRGCEGGTGTKVVPEGRFNLYWENVYLYIVQH